MPIPLKRSVSLVSLLGLMFCAALAQEPDDSRIQKIRRAAERGDASAQWALGFNYENGYLVSKDLAEAAKWYRKAAVQGDRSSQFSLAELYYSGQGVPWRDYAEAAKWYRRAAEQDHAMAHVKLGFMYAKGQGVPQDYVEAVKWYRKAAEWGFEPAQVSLGWMYAEGQGVPQDYVEAHKWVNLAASVPFEGWEEMTLHELSRLGGTAHESLAKARDAIGEKMTREQIEEAQRRAREWKPAATAEKTPPEEITAPPRRPPGALSPPRRGTAGISDVAQTAAILAYLLVFLYAVWRIVIEAFEVHWLLGLACLLFGPLAHLPFIAAHWRRIKTPATLYLVLMVLGFGLGLVAYLIPR